MKYDEINVVKRRTALPGILGGLFLSVTFLALLFLLSGERASGTAAPQALPTPWHARLPNVLYPGIWHFQDLDLASRDYDYLVGAHRVWAWYELNPAPGVYRWHAIEKYLQEAVEAGRPVAIGVNTYDGKLDGGDRTPRWVYDAIPSAQLVCSDGWTIPKFWDERWQQYFETFIAAIAEQYDGDPRIAWVEISVGVYGETAPESITQRAYVEDCLKPAGLDSVLWEQTVKRITDIYVRHFRQTPLFLQMFPKMEKWRERREFANHAASQGVGLKGNGLRAEEGTADFGPCPEDGSGYWSDCEAGIVQLMRKWGNRVPIAWEGDPRFFNPVRDFPRDAPQWAIYWQLLNALDKHSDYILYNENLAQDPRMADLFRWGNRYLGRTVFDTPSVWVALRETALPPKYYPQYGNFSFWLYQNDQAPGGRSVPVWDVGPYPEGFYARRTDEKTGNRYLYFDVDDRYLYDGDARAAIVRVTYLDVGTDAWALDYDGEGGVYTRAGVIQKQNSGQWQKAEFRLDDFRFANRQPGGGAHPGSDFRIDNLGDGDEIVHFVEVERVPFTHPTPTPVPPRIAPPTPTPTPGPPVQEIILQDGREGFAGTKDTYISEQQPTTNFGGVETLSLCSSCPGGGEHRILVRFDLSQALPPDATIVYAWLRLYLLDRSPAKGFYARSHKLLRPWSEGEATWQQAAPGYLWHGPGADTPGIDRSSTWYGQGTVLTVGRWLRVDVTGFVREGWQDPARDFGIILLPFGTEGVRFQFASSEYPDPIRRPMLVVGYISSSTPVPSPTPTPTIPPTPTPTPTPTPVYWVITGLLYDARQGTSAGIGNGIITLTLGLDGPQVGVRTEENGTFAVSAYAPDNGPLRYEARAAGYYPVTGEEPPRTPRRYTLRLGLEPVLPPQNSQRTFFPHLTR